METSKSSEDPIESMISPLSPAERMFTKSTALNTLHSNGQDQDVYEEMLNRECSTQWFPSNSELYSGFSRKELIFLMQQTMESMGYSESRKCFEKESGVVSETTIVRTFYNAIVNGDWNQVADCLEQLRLEETSKKACRFLVLEQKYHESLYEGNLDDALFCLREELEPAAFDQDTRGRMHHCSGLLLSLNKVELQEQSDWKMNGSRDTLWIRLRHLIPSYILPPAGRLINLLLQAQKYQEFSCMYHNYNGVLPYSLLQDHECVRTPIPNTTVAVLEDHSDEVWNIAVSTGGTFLASVSRDSKVIVWRYVKGEFHVNCIFDEHKGEIGIVKWNPEYNLLLTGGNDKTVKIWNVLQKKCVATLEGHSDCITGAAFIQGTNLVISCGLDKQVLLWNIPDMISIAQKATAAETDLSQICPNIVSVWPFQTKLQDIDVTSDGTYAVLVTCDPSVRIYEIRRNKEAFMLPIKDPVMSVRTSLLFAQVLVDVKSNQASIQLYDLTERRIIQKYRGHRGAQFVIRSSFGGPNEGFVISGSEDSLIYIWHRYYGTLLETLSGHAGTVNACLWPINTHGFSELVSASDDRTIRVWTYKKESVKDCDDDHDDCSVL